MVCTCDPRNLGGEGRKIGVQDWPGTKAQDPIWKPNWKQKPLGVMAQVVEHWIQSPGVKRVDLMLSVTTKKQINQHKKT
jgi:hypothetical protein